MKEYFSFPVATAATIESVVRELGLKPWPLVSQLSVEEYLSNCTRTEIEKRRKLLERFGPRSRVDIYLQPDGDYYDAFVMNDRTASGAVSVLELIPRPIWS